MTDTSTEPEAEVEAATTASADVTPRLKTRYREEILPALKTEFEICLLYTSDAADE